MSRERCWDARSPDIAASFLRVRFRRDGWSVGCCSSQTSASVQPGDAADKAGASDGALQLIARLNGKRSPAFRLSACGYGAAPPDQRPRA
jgi:hypothetical protein